MALVTSRTTFSAAALLCALALGLVTTERPEASATPTSVVAPAPSPRAVDARSSRLPEWASGLPSDEGLTDAARDRIHHEALVLARTLPEGSSLRAELFRVVTDEPRCGRAHAAVASAVLAESSAAEVRHALESMRTSCDEVVVEAAGFAREVDMDLVMALERLAHASGTSAVRRSAWLAYGSSGLTARRAGQSAVAARVEEAVLASLRGSRGEARDLAVRAAGNAGCARCVPELSRDLASRDEAVRRAAVAAFRFVEGPAPVASMCAAVAKDGDDGARDLAAWALAWGTSAPAERVVCLERAARHDASHRVRVQATSSLAGLSDDVVAAKDALESLADDEGLAVAPSARRALEVHDDGRPRPLAVRAP